MTAHNLRWARASEKALSRREAAHQRSRRVGDFATIFQRIETYAGPRSYGCAFRGSGAPMISVWPPVPDFPGLEITLGDEGCFVARLRGEFARGRTAIRGSDVPEILCDERYEVIELVVRYIQVSSALRSGTGLDAAPARPLAFPRRRAAVSSAPIVDAADLAAALAGAPAAGEQAEAPAGGQSAAPAPARRRFPISFAMALVAVATGAVFFVFKHMA